MSETDPLNHKEVGFRNLVGVGIAPVSKKTAVKSIRPRLGQCTSMRSKLYNFVSKAQFKIRCTNELFSDWLKDE